MSNKFYFMRKNKVKILILIGLLILSVISLVKLNEVSNITQIATEKKLAESASIPAEYARIYSNI